MLRSLVGSEMCIRDRTHAVPVYSGYVLPHAVQRLELGGNDLTRVLSKNLDLPDTIVTDMKRKMCYVALDPEQETQMPIERSYDLPDESVVTLSLDRFMVPEGLFRPDKEMGVATAIYESLMKVDSDVRPEMYGCIVLAGGNCLFDGFKARLHQEMELLAPATETVRVHACPEADRLAWLGGSLMASLSTFQQMWVTQQEYDEMGPSAIHTKCM
eukprot:TRINITY_DN1547_c0_g1_i1.p1 TRINITY_DN1547_c0_g1~~TRINITY_DN1547_c0_g1_i1.p1  ORF type:complete len:214 (+),score=39.50 TRINITY_DN1547_c0_g1_i1:113-754(+)